ncbi:unnamed protein product, partial [Rotaria magnacalcarata]
KENLAAAENQLSESDNVTWQECMNHLTMKVMQIEQDKMRYERIHEEKSKLYQEYEQQRIKLHHSLTRAIIKSKPYFDAKFKAEHELKNQKYRIEDVQNAIIKAKRTYRAALNSLEQISDEIHRRRKNQILLKLPLREPGVGAETPEEFIELPKIEFSKIDLSNQSSEHDLSKSMNSMSVNTSTDCIYRSSNINLSTNISPLTNNKFEDHCRTQMIASVNNDNDQRMQKRLIPSRSIRLKSTWLHKPNETPLLSHLFGTHKYHSDPNLNASTK